MQSIVTREVYATLRLAHYETDYPDNPALAHLMRWEIQRREVQTHELVSVEGAFVMSARLEIDRNGFVHDRWTVAYVTDTSRRFLLKEADAPSAHALVRGLWSKFNATGSIF